jgi:transposase-like protein
MSASIKQLGRKKEAAILALLSQRNVLDAARSVGVGERTLYRWMQEPDFDAAYRRARRAAFSQATARLQQMCAPAVSTLGKIMLDSNEPAPSRVRAADSILNHAAKALEIEDVLARLSALEGIAAATKKT